MFKYEINMYRNYKKKIREEKKFKNLDMLKLQIQEDISLANKFLKD